MSYRYEYFSIFGRLIHKKCYCNHYSFCMGLYGSTYPKTMCQLIPCSEWIL